MDQNKLCDYGCGKIAIFKFKNGKYCCSNRPTGCSIIKEKYGLKIKKLRLDPNSIYNSEEYKDKFKESRGSFEERIGKEKAINRNNKIKYKAIIRMSVLENRLKTSGLNNYKGGKTNIEVFGKEKADEIGEKIGVVTRGKNYEDFMKDKNKVISRKKQLKNILGDKNHPIHSQQSIEKRSGKNHYMYTPNGKENPDPYTKIIFNKEFRLKIIEDQNNICPVCGKDLGNYRINIHHVNYIKKDDRRINLMMVHHKCNSHVNGKKNNREFWEIKLTYLNEGIINDKNIFNCSK